jgi:hypothetical protein
MPQNALQKSKERLTRSGEFARAYFDKEVVDDWRRADIEFWYVCVAGRKKGSIRVSRVELVAL